MIVGAGNNWDHNERTVDGKRTTHAMTSIIIGDSPGDVPAMKLPRTNAKTLKLSSTNGTQLHNVSFYKKLHTRPEPILREPFVQPHELVVESTTALKVAKMRERLYNIGRCADIFCEDVSVRNVVPPWSIYQSKFEDKVNVPASGISFNPILMSQPTNYSTVYTTLLRMKEVMNKMGQEHVPVFLDMGLLTKALEIVWARSVTLNGVIPCEGAMHLLVCFFAAVGKLYGDSGLRNILSESGAYAAVTAEMILKGKDFDRAMLAYKVLDEVLTRLYLFQFLYWYAKKEKDVFQELTETILKVIGNTAEGQSIPDENILLKLHDSLDPLLEEFSAYASEKSPTFRYWEQFLNEVLLPFKLFVASTRLGDWDIHQSSKKYMLPLLFAADRPNYANYMTVQLLIMERLPKEVLSEFRKGKFAAKISTGIGNTTWIVYILEAIQNKALKGSGGIIGLTLRGDALLRWFLARPTSSKYSMEFHNSISTSTDYEEKESPPPY